MNMRKLAVVAAAFMITTTSVTLIANASGDRQDKNFREALALYQKGMYGQARTIFEGIDDVQAKGYSILCSINLNKPGYENELNGYVADYPFSGLLPKMYWQHALNLFDAGSYDEAKSYFGQLSETDVPKTDLAEYLYKSAYCDFETGDMKNALSKYERVESLPLNDYTAPSRYAIGYINYENEDFKNALTWFEKSVKDPRFEEVSNYYIMECRFMNKDYKYVTDHGAELFGKVPEERKPHLARIISESYLVTGDADKAKEYYDKIATVTGKARGDYFYAGTLMYTIGEYKAAIENYNLMTERTDSIGQIANYNMGYSYIQTKDKVDALGCFKAASEVNHDPRITEDAFYNYAKLSFDINHDNSVFNKYLEKYSDKVKGNAVYSYMALSSLYDHDYAGAVAAYDNIDDLDEDMRGNYMKANYLRAEQLVSNGSWRNAIPCLKAAAYYSDKYSYFNQLSRYWLAESYYRNEQYPLSRSLYTELYNLSALDGKEEGSLIPYDIAYCYFREGNYDSAIKWFDDYLGGSDVTMQKDARVRKADCYFAQKNYSMAAAAYDQAATENEDCHDIYPYYQAGIAYGLAGDMTKKINSLSRVYDADPKDEFFDEACYELGRSFVSQEKNSDAKRCFNAIVDNSEDKAYVAKSLLDLGTIDRNEKKYDSALSSYKKVVSDMPGTEYSNDALLAIELIYQAKGDPEAYVAYVESLGENGTTVDLDKEELLFNAAEQIYLSGNWQKALVSLQNYQSRYPSGRYIPQTDFYIAQAYEGLDRKEQAIDTYAKVLAGSDDSYKEVAALSAARLSSDIENPAEALGFYRKLSEVAKLDANKHIAKLGMMESAYEAKQYEYAADYSGLVSDDPASSDDEKLEAVYIKAKSKLATSDRDDAMNLFKSISSKTKTPQGAEAAYMLIQDASDKGNFEDVETKVYALSDSGCDQTYWLAKSFILLGDSFAERGDYKQARATYESIRDGYQSQGTDDDVLDNVSLRLAKLDKMGK